MSKFSIKRIIKMLLNKKYEVKEGTTFNVEGIDYDIMGKYAEEVKLLRPKMQEKTFEMFKYANLKGWTMIIESGYRSSKVQKHIYKEWKAGRFKSPLVAKPGTSRHEFGCAIDITISGEGSTYAAMGRFGQSIGLSWGGAWKANAECWHFELDPSKTPRGYIKK